MASRSLAVDLKGDGIISVVINPGWVQTDMGGKSATTPVDESVRGILREVDRATLADSGEFLNWVGIETHDCSGSPPQIRTCGFPASGSHLR
jgi:NAD(P)-dependent dehydrogenase (short-subunit alcohol dehydrogenase family)